MKKTIITSIVAITATAIFAINAQALLISVSGPNSVDNSGDTGVAPSIISAPANVFDDGTTNYAMQGFNEAQNVLTTQEYFTDSGFIAEGTWVNSHMIFLNSEGNTRLGNYSVEWSFDGQILGIMSDWYGKLEDVSSDELGAQNTSYPATIFNARGLEASGDPGSKLASGWDGYAILDDTTLSVGMTVTEPGDWIRVVTAPTSPVPEPNTMLLFGTGLVGLAGLARRKKKK